MLMLECIEAFSATLKIFSEASRKRWVYKSFSFFGGLKANSTIDRSNYCTSSHWYVFNRLQKALPLSGVPAINAET
ncbi:hypothetical protein CEXT_61161 [Caerostris extrusa]|uniref:Uncharacterized protein n=1 Tax=Caerostris extrusa TaxID=172846 RepID=A0AAV4SJP4_CAEEX|nr:hypothetical protein CEXT_61161 [Caerostris extrusa]